jgi:hypothetical protein
LLKKKISLTCHDATKKRAVHQEKGKKWAEDKIGCCELLMEKEYFFKQTGGMGIGKYGRRM